MSGSLLVALGLLLFFNRDWWLRVGAESGPAAPRARGGRASRRPRARAPRPRLEQGGDVDAAVRRGVGSQAALGFLQLALAPDPPAAAGLVPGDDDVDEPLEEVALPGPRGAPGELQLLVRLEVLPGARQREPGLEVATREGGSGRCARLRTRR